MNTISRKTLGLIIGLFIVTGILLYMAIMPNSKTTMKPASQAIVPTPTSAAHSDLVFSPSVITATPGKPTTVAIELTTGENDVRAVQLELSYDPAVLTNVSMKEGTFFPNAAALLPPTVVTKTGRISYWIGVPTPRKGTGTVAMLTFTPRAGQTGTSEIKFIPLSKVAAAGVGPSVLKTTSNLTITLGSSTTTQPSTIVPTITPVR